MSLKAKLLSGIVAVIFALSILVVGVLSLTKVDLGVGGNVTFKAKGINCTISSGSLNYGTKSRKDGDNLITDESLVMMGMSYSTKEAKNNTAEKKSWTGLQLEIDEEKNVENRNQLTISFTITNDADEGSFDYISVSVDAKMGADNKNMKPIVTSCPAEIAPKETLPYSLTFEVDDRDIDAHLNGFSVTYTLEYFHNAKVQVNEAGQYRGLQFTPIEESDGSYTASVRAISPSAIAENYPDGALAIPSKIVYQGNTYPVSTIEGGLVNVLDFTTSGGFVGCPIKSLSIPATITSISPLKTLTQQEKLTKVCLMSFAGCPLETIKVDKNNIKYYSEDNGDNYNAIIERTSDTATTLVVGCKNSIIPNGVTKLGYGAFEWCSGLKTIDIPDSVTEFGDSCFAMSGLESIVIPGSIKTISREPTLDTPFDVFSAKFLAYTPFAFCEDLTDIVVEEGVTAVEALAFSTCTSLKNISIPSTITTLGKGVFLNCYSLYSLTIPAGMLLNLTSVDEQFLLGSHHISEYVVNGEAERQALASLLGGPGGIRLASEPSALVKRGDYVFCGNDLIHYTGNESTLSLPTEYGNYRIARYAFTNTARMGIVVKKYDEIIVPACVTGIDTVAFSSNAMFDDSFTCSKITLLPGEGGLGVSIVENSEPFNGPFTLDIRRNNSSFYCPDRAIFGNGTITIGGEVTDVTIQLPGENITVDCEINFENKTGWKASIDGNTWRDVTSEELSSQDTLKELCSTQRYKYWKRSV